MRRRADKINAAAQFLAIFGGCALIGWVFINQAIPSLPVFIAGLVVTLLPTAVAALWTAAR